MFINPFGGKGQGKRIYERKVAPLFTLASITTDIIGKAHEGSVRAIQVQSLEKLLFFLDSVSVAQAGVQWLTVTSASLA